MLQFVNGLQGTVVLQGQLQVGGRCAGLHPHLPDVSACGPLPPTPNVCALAIARPAPPLQYDAARNLTQLINVMYNDRAPALVVFCASQDDVASAVRFAAQRGVPLCVRAGGHDSTGACICDGGVVVDVTGMKQVGAGQRPGRRCAGWPVEEGWGWGRGRHQQAPGHGLPMHGQRRRAPPHPLLAPSLAAYPRRLTCSRSAARRCWARACASVTLCRRCLLAALRP